MFELLVNLMLTGLFLQSQADRQATIDSLAVAEYRLPRAAVKELQQIAPQPKSDSTSVGVAVSAQSALVVDEETGKILYAKNPQAVRPIASLTKLMTALVFLEHHPGWETPVEILPSDYRDGGITYLIAGETVSVRDVFYTALVASANEAAVALSRASGLSEAEFIEAMNTKAAALGMVATGFVDVTGLNAGNRSTAADVILLIRAALADPDLAAAMSTEEHLLAIAKPVGGRTLARQIKSTDMILNQEFGLGAERYLVEAGKTGYLEAAGYCFASRVSSGDGRRILVAVLGSDTITSRFADTKSLAYWVFNNYQW